MRDGASTAILAPSLVDSVRERLIKDILERRYRPGQKLPVVELATRYGVSETPVKQAFNRLVSEGMLIALPRRGVVVHHMSRNQVREIMEARQMVYLACVDPSLAVSDAERERMRADLEPILAAHRALFEDESDAISVDVYLRYVEIDRNFHTVFLNTTGNGVIARFYGQLNNLTYTYVSAATFAANIADRTRQAYAEHTAIVDAWWARDRYRMIEELRRHRQGAIATLNLIFDLEQE